MNRAEHLQWCKDRAIEYIENGDIQEGITSMMSDMNKHPETRSDTLNSLSLMMLTSGQLHSMHKAREFINGFN